MGENCVPLFLYFELLSTQPKPFPSVCLFHQVQVEIVDQCLIPQYVDHFEHYYKFVQDLHELEGEECFVIQYTYSAVLYDVDQNGNCYYWPLHLVTCFHISIVPLIFNSSISILERYLLLIMVHRTIASLLESIFGRAVGLFSLQIS